MLPLEFHFHTLSLSGHLQGKKSTLSFVGPFPKMFTYEDCQTRDQSSCSRDDVSWHHSLKQVQAFWFKMLEQTQQHTFLRASGAKLTIPTPFNASLKRMHTSNPQETKTERCPARLKKSEAHFLHKQASTVSSALQPPASNEVVPCCQTARGSRQGKPTLPQ